MTVVSTIAPLATQTDSSWMMYAGIGTLGLGLLVLLLLAIPKRRSLTTEERVAQYAAQAAGGAPGAAPAASALAPEDSALESAKTAAAAMLKRNRGLENKIAQRLEGAGSKWRPAEWS